MEQGQTRHGLAGGADCVHRAQALLFVLREYGGGLGKRQSDSLTGCWPCLCLCVSVTAAVIE